MKRTMLVAACVAALLAHGALAQPAGMPPISDEAPVYGAQLMTPQERVEHQARMRAAKTLEEREQVRAEHHAAMVTRAKERGITLPDEPPMRAGPMMGGGMGPGMGPGMGSGMGPGMGGGRGR